MTKTTGKKGEIAGGKADMDSCPFRVVLPWPPSVNHYWGTTSTKGRYIKPEGLRFREQVFYGVAEARGPHQRHRPLKGPVSLHLLMAPPDRRVRDFDNILKALLDALQHAGCYQDDCQVRRCYIDFPTYDEVLQLDGVEAGTVSVVLSPFRRDKTRREGAGGA